MFSPINILCFVSGIAMRGKIYTPRVVSKITSTSGKVIFFNVPEFKEMKIQENALENVREGMLAVVEASDGTGRAARVSGIRVAGKTGTAQTSKEGTHAWFVSFAPYDDPQIAVLVIAEYGGMGGSVSAPIAGEIIEKYLEITGEIKPEYETPESENEYNIDSTEKDIYLDKDL